MKRFLSIAFLLCMSGHARGLDLAEVGYCAGPPCCRYERSGCSERDNRSLIAMSRIVSGPHAFCAKLMEARWRYIPLDLDHSVDACEVNEYLSVPGATTAISAKGGYFDINNDGVPENIGWLSAYSGAGQGCDVEVFVELDAERSHIKRSRLSALLSDYSCRDYHRAFRFDNTTYIENRRTLKDETLDLMFPSILTEVIIIEGDLRRSVCTFEIKSPWWED